MHRLRHHLESNVKRQHFVLIIPNDSEKKNAVVRTRVLPRIQFRSVLVLPKERQERGFEEQQHTLEEQQLAELFRDPVRTSATSRRR